METNYNRYHDIDSTGYERPTFLSQLLGKTAQTRIGGYLQSLRSRTVLELGCGTGIYTKFLLGHNQVTCIDINPHLFALEGAKLIAGNCTALDTLLPAEERFDAIVSIWMTEYLSPGEVEAMLTKARGFLAKDGRILITFISYGMLGCGYVFGARLKGIRKYHYCHKRIQGLCTRLQLTIDKYTPIGRFGLELGKFYSIAQQHGISRSESGAGMETTGE